MVNGVIRIDQTPDIFFLNMKFALISGLLSMRINGS